MKKKTILIITTSGGRGHLEAAKAKKQQILTENPKATIIEKNVLRDWGWKFITGFLKTWNSAQMLGKVKTLMRFVNMQVYADWMIAPRVFLSFYRLMRNEKVDRIIDTQNLGLSSILKALRLYNWMYSKNVLLEKVIVDLPTKDATTFFPFIKRISTKDRKYLRLISIHPLLEDENNEEEFWQKYCKMPEKHISYEEEFIRKSFKEIKNSSYKKAFDMPFEMNEEMIPLVEKFLDKKQLKGNSYHCKIKKDDLLITIFLGAQPAIQGTLSYLEETLKQCTKLEQSIYLVVFTSNHHSKYKSLLELVCEKLGEKRTKKNIHVIPVCFQSEEVISKLIFRSDLTISRSGGQTAMELLYLRKNRETWIHSETKVAIENHAALLHGMPIWEAGNARYLQSKIGAKITNPILFKKQLKAYLKTKQLAVR